MRKILVKIQVFRYTGNKLFCTKPNLELQSADKNIGSLIISCKRPYLNYYSSVHYDKFDTVSLASKGWNHTKSKGDFFTVHPYKDGPCDMYSFKELGLHPSIIQTLFTDGIIKATDFQLRTTQAIKTGN